MQYTSRLNTPLKWLKLVKYVLLPLIILSLVYDLACLTNELFFLGFTNLPNVLTPIISAFGNTISHLGNSFWFVVGYFILICFRLYFSITSFVGLIRFKSKGITSWYIYLLLTLSQAMFVAIISYVIAKSNIIYLERIVNNYFYIFSNKQQTIEMLTYVLLAVAILNTLWHFIYLILNMIYFKKRKSLFADTYVEETISTDAPVVQKKTFCTNCGAELTEADQNFCTHCGHKISE